MEAWMRVELNYMRALRHPCLVSDLQTRGVSAWTRTGNSVTTDVAAPMAVWERVTS
jgi:hypothetical protein